MKLRWKHVFWTVLILTLAPLLFEKRGPTTQDLEENLFVGALL